MSDADAVTQDLEQLTSEAFRDVIGRFASGVTVVTAVSDGRMLGTTASAFTSLSLEPPMILICMNKSSDTGRAIDRSGDFAVNILGEAHPDLAMRFAGKGDNKFDGIGVEPGANGQPLLVDALATLECKVTERTEGGTHLVFLALVERAAATHGNPLTYFRGQFGRFKHDDDEAAYRSLRQLVVERAIPIDQPLDLDALAQTTGIDRSTVYHGLSQLVDGGLVRREHDGRFQVVAVTPELMEDGLRGRASIEIGVAMQRAGNITPEEIARCELLLTAMEALEDGPIRNWIDALNDYLDCFVSLAGSTALLDSFRRLNQTGLISSTRWASMSDHGLPARPTETHRAVLRALVDNDRQAALDAIEQRVEGTIRALRDSIERSGGEV